MPWEILRGERDLDCINRHGMEVWHDSSTGGMDDARNEEPYYNKHINASEGCGGSPTSEGGYHGRPVHIYLERR